MKIYNVEQRSEEWYRLRAGLLTASSFDKVVTTKGEVSKQLEKHLFKLAGEKILGVPEESYQNEAMKRGIELEDEARMCYELMTGNSVDKVGLCIHDDGFGCSPDGFVGEEGGLEIKCPNLATHVSYLIDDVLPSEYFQQVQGSMLVTGRKWWSFVSYYPGLRTLLLTVDRDDVFCNKLYEELKKSVKKIDEIVNKIK